MILLSFLVLFLFRFGEAEYCSWNKSLQLESSHDRKVFSLHETVKKSSCEYFESQLTIESPLPNLHGHALHLKFACNGDINCADFLRGLEVYELVNVNGLVYRIPRHRNDIPRDEYVGARDSAFLLIIKSKKEGLELDVHYSYTTSSDYNHLRKGNLNYSCPFPLISLNDDNPEFRPSDDFAAFDCAVQLNSTSNVQHLMRYSVDEWKLLYRIYHTNWESPPNKASSFEPSMDRKLNSSESYSMIALFGSSFVISFWQNMYRDFSPFTRPYLIRLAPSCSCDSDTDHLIGEDDKMNITRPFYPHPDGLNITGFQCFHIECSRTIHLNPTIESTHRINVEVPREVLHPSISLIDGNFTISNVITDFSKYVFNSPCAVIQFHAVCEFDFARPHASKALQFEIAPFFEECQCPNISGSFAHFEFLRTCEHVDCIFELTGAASFLTYDPYHACFGERVLYRSNGGDIHDIYKGRNAIHSPIGEPVMVLFHRTRVCEQHSFSVVALGDSACSCAFETIYLLPGESHELLSPGYGTTFSYCPLMNCTSFFKAPKDHHIVFSINDFDVADDQLKIFFGESREDYMMSFTSYEEEPDEVDTGEREIMINFVSDDMEQGKGYNITVRAIPFEKVEEGISWWMIGVFFIVISAIAALGFVQRDRIRNGITAIRMGRRFGGVFTNPFIDTEDQFL